MSKENEKKQKKEKIVYVDDGSTVVDMSALGTDRKAPRNTMYSSAKKTKARWREILGTYLESMRMMLIPMLIVMGLITVVFGVLWLIFTFLV
ncbi:MAG: hypothetical protein IJX13_02200 [Clostridia bacterium]|nr:hypothetical protein [Clostridia bacterium]